MPLRQDSVAHSRVNGSTSRLPETPSTGSMRGSSFTAAFGLDEGPPSALAASTSRHARHRVAAEPPLATPCSTSDGYLTRPGKAPLSRFCNQQVVNEHPWPRLRPLPLGTRAPHPADRPRKAARQSASRWHAHRSGRYGWDRDWRRSPRGASTHLLPLGRCRGGPEAAATTTTSLLVGHGRW